MLVRAFINAEEPVPAHHCSNAQTREIVDTCIRKYANARKYSLTANNTDCILDLHEPIRSIGLAAARCVSVIGLTVKERANWR